MSRRVMPIASNRYSGQALESCNRRCPFDSPCLTSLSHITIVSAISYRPMTRVKLSRMHIFLLGDLCIEFHGEERVLSIARSGVASDARDWDRLTALIGAAAAGRSNVLAILLDAGAAGRAPSAFHSGVQRTATQVRTRARLTRTVSLRSWRQQSVRPTPFYPKGVTSCAGGHAAIAESLLDTAPGNLCDSTR